MQKNMTVPKVSTSYGFKANPGNFIKALFSLIFLKILWSPWPSNLNPDFQYTLESVQSLIIFKKNYLEPPQNQLQMFSKNTST
jgi:hypothetical protein